MLSMLLMRLPTGRAVAGMIESERQTGGEDGEWEIDVTTRVVVAVRGFGPEVEVDVVAGQPRFRGRWLITVVEPRRDGARVTLTRAIDRPGIAALEVDMTREETQALIDASIARHRAIADAHQSVPVYTLAYSDDGLSVRLLVDGVEQDTLDLTEFLTAAGVVWV